MYHLSLLLINSLLILGFIEFVSNKFVLKWVLKVFRVKFQFEIYTVNWDKAIIFEKERIMFIL